MAPRRSPPRAKAGIDIQALHDVVVSGGANSVMFERLIRCRSPTTTAPPVPPSRMPQGYALLHEHDRTCRWPRSWPRQRTRPMSWPRTWVMAIAASHDSSICWARSTALPSERSSGILTDVRSMSPWSAPVLPEPARPTGLRRPGLGHRHQSPEPPGRAWLCEGVRRQRRPISLEPGSRPGRIGSGLCTKHGIALRPRSPFTDRAGIATAAVSRRPDLGRRAGSPNGAGARRPRMRSR